MTFIPIQPIEGKVFGTDVSFYQDENETPQGIDFEKMKRAGAAFTIIRAGQNLWEDQDFRTNWRNSKGILPRGAYFYLDVRASIRQQAKIFANVLSEDAGELPWTVDFEQIASAKVNGEKQQLNISHLDGFLTYMREYLARDTRVPFIYTGYYFWRDFGSTHVRFAQHPLWIARYKADAPLVPAPWKSWTLWQAGDTFDGKKFGVESHAIDGNYFNGTVEELYAWVGWNSTGGTIPEDPSDPPDGDWKQLYEGAKSKLDRIRKVVEE